MDIIVPNNLDRVSCIAARGYYYEGNAQDKNVTYFPTKQNKNLYIMVSNSCLEDFVRNHPNGPGTATIDENFGKMLFLRKDSTFKEHLGKVGDYWDIKHVY